MLPNSFPWKASVEGAPGPQLLLRRRSLNGNVQTHLCFHTGRAVHPCARVICSGLHTLRDRQTCWLSTHHLAHFDKHSRDHSVQSPASRQICSNLPQTAWVSASQRQAISSFQWKIFPVFNNPPPMKHFPFGISDVHARRELGNHVDKAFHFRNGKIQGSPFLEQHCPPPCRTDTQGLAGITPPVDSFSPWSKETDF